MFFFSSRYNVGCTKRMGLFPRKSTSENPKKQKASNTNHHNSSMDVRKRVIAVSCPIWFVYAEMCLLVSLVFSHRIQVLKQPWPRLCYPHTPLIQVTVSPASAQTCPASKSPFRHCPTPALEPKGFRTRKDSITVESSLSWRSTSWPATPPSGTSRTSMNSSALCQVATIMFLGFFVSQMT